MKRIKQIPKPRLKSAFYIELLFLLFITLNMVKLTGVQYFMTWNSGFEVYKMVLKNTAFLYVFWRLVFLQPSKHIFTAALIIQDLYLAILLLYYIYSGNIINLSQLQVLGEGVEAMTTLSAVVIDARLLLLLVDIPLVIYLYRSYKRLRGGMFLLNIPLLAASGIVLFLLVHRLDYFRATGVEWGYIGQNAKFGTIYTSLVLNNTAGQEEAIESLRYGPTESIEGKENNYNIVTIQVESLNIDIVHHRHQGELVTPFLNSLTRNSLYYPRMLTQHRAGGSSDAEFSVFNGSEALYSFPVCQFDDYSYPNSLLHRLEGYTKYAFHGNSGEYFNRNQNLPAMGFDAFFDIFKMDLSEEGWGASDRAVFEYMLEKASHAQELFYFHVITMSSHGPFNLVKQYYENPLFDNISSATERNYLLSMNYVDAQLEYFVNELQRLHPDTYIFIYSDHSVRFDGSHYQPNSRTVYKGDKFEFVPLFIISPQPRSQRVDGKIAAFLDMGLTVLEAAGVEAEIRTLGNNLLEPSGVEDNIVHFGNEYSRRALAEIDIEQN